MKASVIVLTCDREHWIGRSIRSILRQDFPDFELIVVDNGSRDASGLIAAEYARRDPRVRVLRRERGTISAGRNAGLDAARGEWIAFFDDDDTAEPDFLSFLVALAEETGADAAACGSWKEVDGRRLPNFIEDRRLLLTPEQAVLELLLRRRCNAATPTKLFRRSLFSEHRFPERARYDDIAVVYRLFASARRVAFHNLPKYCFTRHGGNSSAFTTNDRLLSPAQLREYFTAFHERTRWLSDRLPRLSAFARYAEYSYYLSMFAKLTRTHLPDCESERLWLADTLREALPWLEPCPWLQDFERARLCLLPRKGGR
ncbi:glycosyltransferase family 2 protein [Anaeromassilibacillus sp. An200]|uniref:glycosyltransferase family 2 protein n=1 Tax=Anaeromassilibacillus sp. An200 TaxID=1965587 RepID=UPI000B3AF473|nr:glycosyltransferase family 2 protein [Anaeromassilibacillus sp. An200]OUP14072.1 hypothetical protein B5F35_01830 [Anaeromassilibacillus sp. An200]